MKNLRADCVLQVPTTIWLRILCLPVCHLKNFKIKICTTIILLVLCQCETGQIY